MRDADRVIGPLNTHGVSPVQLVLNRVRPKMMANQEMLAVDDVTDILALPLLGLVLEDEQVIVSTNRGEPLTLNGSHFCVCVYGNVPVDCREKKCHSSILQRAEDSAPRCADYAKEDAETDDPARHSRQIAEPTARQRRTM